MFLMLRTLVYATVFVGFLLIYLPARLLAYTGFQPPPAAELPQIAGMILAALGAALALWCVTAFVRMGKGTPAPFDAPRRLVIRGPYRFVRNPMYMGAATVLAGAAIFYRSVEIAAYAAAFLMVFHFVVIFYEEPTLRSKFGLDYLAYCRRVRRWWPRFHAAPA